MILLGVVVLSLISIIILLGVLISSLMWIMINDIIRSVYIIFTKPCGEYHPVGPALVGDHPGGWERIQGLVIHLNGGRYQPCGRS